MIIWLGSGWYTEGLPGVVGNGPLVRTQLERVSGELRDIILGTDASWVGRDSEYTRISDWRSGRYGGERIEGNLGKRNMALKSPDELVWGRVSVVEVPKHEVTPQMVEPNQIMDTINPVNVSPLGDKTYLVDCPQIERLGYGGDGNASTITAQTMFNMAPLYNNWLQAWADVIREDGSMPHTAPNPYRAGGGLYWCGFIISASWNTYQNYGDAGILEKKTYPGYLYMLENGATTTWEHWDGQRSRIHNCYNGVGKWFYQVVGGIQTVDGNPAYREFLVHPQIPHGVTWAKTQLETQMGTIVVNWNLSADNMKMEIVVPVGSTAKVHCPDDATDVKIDHDAVRVPTDTISLESGKHFVEYVLKTN